MEHLPAVSGPSGECKAPRCSNERVCRPREVEQLPRVTEPAGSCAGTQTHQGPPEGCPLEHTAPPGLEGMLFPLPLALRPSTGDPAGTWCSTHSTISPPLLHPRRMGGDPPGAVRRSPKHPQVASHMTSFAAAHVGKTHGLTHVQMGFAATHQRGDPKQTLCTQVGTQPLPPTARCSPLVHLPGPQR